MSEGISKPQRLLSAVPSIGARRGARCPVRTGGNFNRLQDFFVIVSTSTKEQAMKNNERKQCAQQYRVHKEMFDEWDPHASTWSPCS
eukprot:2273139-Amphidinium_carterae.2